MCYIVGMVNSPATGILICRFEAPQALRASSPRGSTPSQALPRQLPQRGSQAVNLDAKVLGTKRKFPGVLLAPPSGELASRSDD